MLPDHLVHQFWDDVKKQLQSRYKFSREDADRNVEVFCDRMRAHGGTEMVYHQNPEDVVDAVYHSASCAPSEPNTDDARCAWAKAHPDLADFITSQG